MKKKKDISYRDFNPLVARAGHTHPTQDSPGDTGDDELMETILGKNFSGEENAEDQENEEYELAENPAEGSEEVDSERPDPESDLHRDTSVA